MPSKREPIVISCNQSPPLLKSFPYSLPAVTDSLSGRRAGQRHPITSINIFSRKIGDKKRRMVDSIRLLLPYYSIIIWSSYAICITATSNSFANDNKGTHFSIPSYLSFATCISRRFARTGFQHASIFINHSTYPSIQSNNVCGRNI